MSSQSRNIRLTIAYDGSRYVGWQIQPNGLSIQQVVTDAVRRLTGEEIKLIAAGRTDSGVHALGQVANFHTVGTIPADKFRPALQGLLPDDVVVVDSGEVPSEFHATYSAIRKCYRYVMHLGETSLPFYSRYAWRVGGELNLPAMQAAAGHVVGTHDFRCFETQFPNKATSVRTVESARLALRPAWLMWTGFDFAAGESVIGPEGEFLVFEIAADGFLYNMVRAIVGTLVDVGRGRFTADDVARMIADGDRSLAGPTAPPQGLFLVSVDYDLANLRPKFAGDA